MAPVPTNAYPYPAPQLQQQRDQKTNGLAIAGMVLGILWLYWIGSILALVFGYVAKGQIDRSDGAQSGRGMAITAIVLGWIGIGTVVVMLILLSAGAASAPGG